MVGYVQFVYFDWHERVGVVWIGVGGFGVANVGGLELEWKD